MQGRKSILAYTLIAGSILATAGGSAKAASIFSFNNAGNGSHAHNKVVTKQKVKNEGALINEPQTKADSTAKKTENED